jgi:hypothetical protein
LKRIEEIQMPSITSQDSAAKDVKPIDFVTTTYPAIELVTICLDTSHDKAQYIVIDPGEGPQFTKKGTNNKNTCQLHERSRSVVVELQPGYLLVHGSKLRGSNFFAKYLLPTTKIINREQSGPFDVAQYQKGGNRAGPFGPRITHRQVYH